jgi:hypothetical protein
MRRAFFGIVITFKKNEVDATAIEKCLAVGMVYAISLEDPPMPSVAFSYPMNDLMNKLRRETGLDLCVDAREFANSNNPSRLPKHQGVHQN